MKTNRLSNPITAALNEQMTNEAYAAQVYLSYAAWASNEGYNGIANFLFKHANEERSHMMKLLEYMLVRGAVVQVTAIPGPPEAPSSVQECFEKIFDHEVENTTSVYKLVKMSVETEDWATWNFMQWFVNEQVEEEALAMELLNKIKIAGGYQADGNSLFVLDNDLSKGLEDPKPPQEATTVNP